MKSSRSACGSGGDGAASRAHASAKSAPTPAFIVFVIIKPGRLGGLRSGAPSLMMTKVAAALFTRPERRQIGGFVGVILVLHLAGWGLVWWWARSYPFVIGLAGLAYSFGLRHAFDADHIAAIDNTTRKLMTGGTRPLGVGFFFSLGHSTVVFLMTVAIAVAAHVVTTELPRLREIGSLVGTTISGVFLYVIGVLNL